MKYPKWGNATADVGAATDDTVGLLPITTGRAFWMRGIYFQAVASDGGLNVFDATAGATGAGMAKLFVTAATNADVLGHKCLHTFNPPGIKFSTGVSVARAISDACTAFSVGCYGYEE